MYPDFQRTSKSLAASTATACAAAKHMLFAFESSKMNERYTFIITSGLD
jgi:hypothetical protein